ncbi:MAG: Calx-beta domain-containing protein [Deltaproteobacteria bacterium]
MKKSSSKRFLAWLLAFALVFCQVEIPVMAEGGGSAATNKQIAAGQYHTVALKVNGTVWAWGANGNGQLGDGTETDSKTPVQVSNISGITSVAAGANHTLALKSDGTVWAWGYNGNGQLGNNSETSSKIPVQVSGLSGVNAIAAGAYHSVAVTAAGEVWTWGYNGNGQLGNDSDVSSKVPVKLTTVSGAAEVSAGLYHTAVVTSAGEVWTWGYNGSGQLGNNTTVDSKIPIKAAGITDAVSVAAGANHTVALRTGGTVLVWGSNGYGQLGDGSGVDQLVPVEISGLTGVSAIRAGANHTTALKTDKSVVAWGYNGYGQIGDNSTTQKTSPTAVTGLTSNVTAIAAGTNHTVALKTDGTVWTWGNNVSGQLGDGTTTQRNAPVQVPGLDLLKILTPGGSMTKQIAGGGYHTVALKTDGTVWTWGRNNNGQLGDNSTVQKNILGQVKSSDGTLSLTRITAVAAGEYHTAALRSDGTVWTWGNAENGRLGNNSSTGQRNIPVQAQATGFTSVAAIAAGQTHTMAVTTAGDVWAWGNNGNGQLGDGSNTQRNVPTKLTGVSGVAAIAAGQSFTAALKADKTVWTWGNNDKGQLGDGSITPRNTPAQVAGLTGIIAISTGANHVVALKEDGTVWAWGNNESGQLGDGTKFQRNTPVLINNVGGVSAIAAGEYHTIVLKSDGTVWAWGSNNYGQLGNGSGGTGEYSTTAAQIGGMTGVISIAGGASHTLALKSDGTVWTWGWNGFGQLGDNTVTQRNTPVKVYNCLLFKRLLPEDTYVQVVESGYYTSAGLKSDGTVWTWGYNGHGQLGNGNTTDSYTRVQVQGLTGVVSIAAGEYHMAALKSDGTVWCWGYNANGELGNNDPNNANSAIPVQVGGLYDVKAIAAGYNYTVALKSDGTVWTWGLNDNMQLGRGANNTTPSKTPVMVPKSASVDGFNNIKAIASGDYHVIALKEDGTVWTWGNNGYQQLGDGTTTNNGVPLKISGLVGVVAITGTAYSTAVLKADGTVWNWGNGAYGLLGDGLSTSGYVPVQVKSTESSGYLTDVVKIKGGLYYMTALKSDGTVWTWGYNPYSNLGRSDNSVIAGRVVSPDGTGFLTGIVGISAGEYTSIALKSDGTVWTWGFNNCGQLGIGGVSPGSSTNPVKVNDLNLYRVLIPGENASKKLAGGDFHTAVLKSNGTVWTWGRNNKGQLGDGTTTQRNAPVQVSGLSTVTAVAGGANHTMALKSDGTVWGWGNNEKGQLGDNSTTNRLSPVKASGLTGVAAIDAGANHTVALKGDGTVWAWGYNEQGQLGDGTIADKQTPKQIGGLTGVAAIAAGANHTVALKTEGTVWTWGFNGSGQLGIGNTDNKSAPIKVDGLTDVVAISAGADYTIALKSNGDTYVWGNNEFGQLGDTSQTNRTTPVLASGLNGAAVAAGQTHTVVLKQDCSVWACGKNASGQLGNNSIEQSSTAVQVKKDINNMFTGVKEVIAGGNHVVALKIDGTVWAWGNNEYGQLGDASSGTNRLMPVQVADMNLLQLLSTGENMTKQIAGGANHTIALKSDGTVWTWGLNTNGQLGNNSTTQSIAPVQVKNTAGTAGLTGITAVAAGANHTAALKSDGTVWTWGLNTSYQLGVGSPSQRTTPIQISGLTEVAAIATGANHTIALKNDGTVYTWGLNTSGQLGDNTQANKSAPVNVSGLTGVAAIAAGTSHTLALKKDGTVWAWGLNDNGRLGNNSTTQSLVPVQVKDTAGTGNLTGVIAIAAGASHSVALKSDGTVWTWGLNANGQLGDNSTDQKLTPTQITGVNGIAAISAGQAHTAVLKTDGTAYAWGYNEYGQLGDGTASQRIAPVSISGLNDTISIASGANHTIVLKADGTVWTCGYNSNGQLGDSTTTNRYILVQVSGLNLKKLLAQGNNMIKQIAAGVSHTVVLKADGTVWAWGSNEYGQLGNNTGTSSSIPVQVSSLTKVSAVAAGGNHTIALKRDGTVWTWGKNISGQLGDSTVTQRNTPVQVPGLTGITAIAGGENHTLAVKSDGTVWAWGLNDEGQLGDNTLTQRNSPVQVSGLTGVVSIAGGSKHSVSLRDDGTVWTWGNNALGQLGNVTGAQSKIPVQMTGATGVTTIATGANHTIVVKPDSSVWACGSNDKGQLGDGSTTYKTTIVQISGLDNVSFVAGGAKHTIALKKDGTVWAWGDNEKGQLGDTTGVQKSTPVQVKESAGNAQITEVVAIAGGAKHTAVLRIDGKVWTGGFNEKGQLGDNSVIDKNPLVQAVNINVLQVLATAAPTASDSGNDTRREISVSFNGTDDETYITGYRIFIVPSYKVSSFTLDVASGLDSTKYKQEEKKGTNASHTVVVTTAVKDCMGADITTDKTYKMFIMSVGENGYVSSLSSGSNSICYLCSLDFSSSTYSVDEDGSNITITVVRSDNLTGSTSIEYATSDGTAAAGVHYTAASGTLNFAEGESSKTFNISITDNTIYSGNKVINLSLKNPGTRARIGQQGTAVVNILDDEPAAIAKVQFASDSYSVNENGGSATITVTRIENISGTTRVNYETSNGTASSGVHYSAVTGALNFIEGESSKTFTVPIIDNGVFAGDKTVNLTLKSPTGGAELGTPSSATLNIIEDEAYATADAAVEGSGGSLIVVDDGTSYTNSNSLQLHLTQLNNVKNVRVSLDGISWSPYEEVLGNEFTKQITFIGGSDGEKSVFYQFQNPAGKESRILSKKLFIDTTAPTVSLQTTDGSMIAKNGVFKFRVNINEKASKKIIYNIVVNDEAVVSDTTTTSRNFNVLLSDLTLNEYSLISISVRDVVGNETEKNVSVLAK